MNSPLVHRVRRPEVSSVRPPLLLLLHGVGSNENDLFGLEQAFDPRFVVVSARAPLTVRTGAYAWFPVQLGPQGPVIDAAQAEASRVLVAQFVDWAVAEYGANPARVFVAGFSQGAIMTASLALTEPEKVAGAVLMSGRILPEVVPLVAPLPRRLAPSYLVVHGVEDAVLPLFHGQASRTTLQGLGIEPEYRAFPMGHTVSQESLAAVSAWVNSRVSSEL